MEKLQEIQNNWRNMVPLAKYGSLLYIFCRRLCDLPLILVSLIVGSVKELF